MLSTDIQIPRLPLFKKESPRIVIVLDKINNKLNKKGEEYSEFYWFARDYPRLYRYHIDNIEFRLKTIYELYDLHRNDFLKNYEIEDSNNCFGMVQSNINSFRIYWEFEALLSATNSALDLMARIIGTAYEQQTPVSLNKIVRKQELSGLIDILRKSKTDWVDELKDYRDCFVHYTPVDRRVYVILYRIKDKWKMWCKIPINPNIREVNGFRFSKKRDLLRYSIKIYQKLMKLDRDIAREIVKEYQNNNFPKRINNLFFIGSRNR